MDELDDLKQSNRERTDRLKTQRAVIQGTDMLRIQCYLQTLLGDALDEAEFHFQTEYAKFLDKIEEQHALARLQIVQPGPQRNGQHP